MNGWKHLTLEQRKVITNGISKHDKLKIIAEALGYDPTSISKEVKRNRKAQTIGKNITNCNKVNRWPFVCTGCKKKYGKDCVFTKYVYDPIVAQEKAKKNLSISRKGIDIDDNDFKKLDNLVKTGIENKKSIYQIVIENKNEIDKSVSTIYRYVNDGLLQIKKLIYDMLLLIRKGNIIKSMTILKTKKLTEQVILTLIILPLFIKTQEFMFGN